MTRTITLQEFINLGVSTHSVKDSSPRGFSKKGIDDVKVGDMIVLAKPRSITKNL